MDMHITEQPKGRLLLLTKHFPFNRGDTPAESYLETEINIIANDFESVVVLATEASASAAAEQRVPQNVRAFALGFTQGKLEKARSLLRGLRNATYSSEAVDALKSDDNLTLQQIIYQRFFIGKALRKWDVAQRWITEENFLPTHIYSFWFHDMALLACWVKRKYPKAYAMARAHGYDLYHERARCGKLPCRLYMLEALDAVLPCSDDGSQYLKERYRPFASKISTCYLGTQELPDKSLELRDGTFKVVSCSSVTKIKRVPLLAKAIGLLDSMGKQLEWVHYGDGPEMSKVKEIAARYRNVKAIFPGSLSNADLLAQYREKHFDLFVNVSANEGLPISIMEASGFGIPVLATNVGGVHEIVTDGFNGFLISSKANDMLIAEYIDRIMNMNQALIISMRISARKRWETSFQATNNIDKFLSHAVLNEKGPLDRA